MNFDLSSQQFVAVRRSLVGRLKHLRFTSKDVKLDKTKKSGDLSESFEANIKGQSVTFYSQYFASPAWYNMMAGFGDI